MFLFCQTIWYECVNISDNFQNHNQCKADSISKCNSQWWLSVAHRLPEKHLKRGSESKHFTGSVVEAIHCALHFFLGHMDQLHRLGEELIKQLAIRLSR